MTAQPCLMMNIISLAYTTQRTVWR